jgi:hypothetical protein
MQARACLFGLSSSLFGFAPPPPFFPTHLDSTWRWRRNETRGSFFVLSESKTKQTRLFFWGGGLCVLCALCFIYRLNCVRMCAHNHVAHDDVLRLGAEKVRQLGRARTRTQEYPPRNKPRLTAPRLSLHSAATAGLLFLYIYIALSHSHVVSLGASSRMRVA